MSDEFEIISPLQSIDTIAVGRDIHELDNLRELFGRGRWRKLKALAVIQLPNGTRYEAELHWYEANGIGKRKMKIKRLIRKLK